MVCFLHGLALWAWHLPALYQAALGSAAIHATEHVCFLGTACLFWWALIHGRYGRLGYGMAAVFVFVTGVHSEVLGALLGLCFPVCDCGVIPLARRLGAKGLPLYATTTFILAAPVVNPVVLASTAVAFQGDWTIVGLRMAMSLSVAVTVGLLAATLMPDAQPLSVPGPALRAASGQDRRGGALADVVEHAVAEYFDISLFIVLGALFTAVTQTFVPRGDLVALGSSRIGSVVALMPLATLLSICSEAAAFVARAFAATFSTGALLAFMTIGQIVDLRNGLLLFRTLPGRLVTLIVVVAYGLIFVESLAVNRVLLGP